MIVRETRNTSRLALLRAQMPCKCLCRLTQYDAITLRMRWMYAVVSSSVPLPYIRYSSFFQDHHTNILDTRAGGSCALRPRLSFSS